MAQILCDVISALAMAKSRLRRQSSELIENRPLDTLLDEASNEVELREALPLE